MARKTPFSVILAVVLSATCCDATVIYDSGGFESPRFNANSDLAGQDPIVPPLGYGPWHRDAGLSTAVVQTDTTGSGFQSVKMMRTNDVAGDTRWGVTVPITPTAASNVVSIDVDFYTAISPGTNWGGPDVGPLFGIECYDGSSGTPKLIGSLFLDSFTGNVIYQEAGDGTLQNSGTFIRRNQYHHYTLAANFTKKTYSIYVDGNLVHTEGFVDATAAAFTDAPITVLAGSTNDPEAAGTAYFDNYTISLGSSRLDHLIWHGDGLSNSWDINTSSNWFNGDGLDVFTNNSAVVFDDTGSNTPSINLEGTLQPSAITVNASQSYSFDGTGVLGGSAALLKYGSGTLSVSGANTYSGGTTVSNGTLLVNNTTGSGTGSGPIFIGAGATLGGSGSVAGAVTVANGGTISPGNTVGTLTLNSDLTSSGATLRFDVGTASDHLVVGGNLTLGGVLDVSDSGGLAPGVYNLISYTGTLSGPGLAIENAPSTYNYAIDTNTPGSVNLVVSIPPPPPLAPSGLTATAVSDREIDLAWIDNSTNETQFLIERSINNSVFTQIASLPADSTNYADTGLSSASTYYYRVRASNSGGNSAYSGVVAATTLLSTEPPVSYYKFEFNTLDSSGNNNDGVPAGALTYGTGKVGTYSAQFDGTSSFIEIQPVARTNFTIAMWVQTTNSATGSVWYQGSGLVDGEVVGAAADWGSSILNSKFAVGIGNPDTTFSTGVSVTDGNWHYLVATRDSGSGLVKLYVDGALNALGIGPTGPRTAPNDLRIGATHATTPVFLKGNIDDLRIYDYVLNDAQITMLAGRAARIASIRNDGTQAVITGNGGPPEGTYYVLSSTNVALPLAQWTCESTNQFDESGNCTYTNTINPADKSKFFILQLP